MSKNNFPDSFSFSASKKDTINDYIFSEYEKNVNIKKLLRSKSKIIDSLIENILEGK